MEYQVHLSWMAERENLVNESNNLNVILAL